MDNYLKEILAFVYYSSIVNSQPRNETFSVIFVSKHVLIVLFSYLHFLENRFYNKENILFPPVHRICHFMQMKSLQETVCMKCQILFSRICHFMQIISFRDHLFEMSNLFSGKNNKNISKCYLKFLLSMLSVKC